MGVDARPPFGCTSKWRWGAPYRASPVLPTAPIRMPAATRLPGASPGGIGSRWASWCSVPAASRVQIQMPPTPRSVLVSRRAVASVADTTGVPPQARRLGGRGLAQLEPDALQERGSATPVGAWPTSPWTARTAASLIGPKARVGRDPLPAGDQGAPQLAHGRAGVAPAQGREGRP